MQSHRKSKNSGDGDHSEKNPLRSNKLNTNIARKPSRTGRPSRDQAAAEDYAQDISLQGKNLQSPRGRSERDRSEHSRTAEIESAPLIDREAS